MQLILISDLLTQRYPSIARAISETCQEEHAMLAEAKGTKDIWIRDYMPVVLPDDSMIQFNYKPSYLYPEYTQLITRPEDVNLPFAFRKKRSKIILDGGNYVRLGNKVLICDRVVAENPGLSKEQLINQLTRLLKATEIVLLPTHPFDPTGHADGIVTPVSESNVLIESSTNYSSKEEIQFHHRLRQTLTAHSIGITECPTEPPTDGYHDEWDCRGSYLNVVRIGRTVLIPFYAHSDKHRVHSFFIAAFRKYKVRLVQCDALAEEGGALHCVTWSI
jgi:agmatine/peptidylarginine deiminase